MVKYRILKKNGRYTVKVGKRIFPGIYQRRFLNKTLNKWTYIFKSLDGFASYTLLSSKCTVYDFFNV